MNKIVLIICVALLSSVSILAQKNEVEIEKSNESHVKITSDLEPVIYVDGKKFDFSIDLINPDKIDSISVVKGERAIKDYGAENGVVLIVTKKKENDSKIKLTDNTPSDNAPLIIIDGKKTSQGLLEKLDPDDIELVEVVKGEEAIDKYNAPNGVIVVTTKKKKKE